MSLITAIVVFGGTAGLFVYIMAFFLHKEYDRKIEYEVQKRVKKEKK